MPTVAENRKAFHDYTIIDTFEAGIVLSGQEAKSAKNGQVSLKGSFVKIRNGEAYLVNAHISEYQKALPDPAYVPTQSRKLLLTRRELDKITEERESQGLAIVPLSMFTRRNFIKVKIGLARGKKKYDKRQSIKEREVSRKIQRTVER